MKIAVLVKQVIGLESALEISEDNTWVKEENASFVMNPPDNYAIEEGLTIKEKRNKNCSISKHREKPVYRKSFCSPNI